MPEDETAGTHHADDAEAQRPRRRTRRIMLGAGLLISLIAAVAIAVAVSAKGKSAPSYPDAAAVLAALQSAGIPCTQIPGTYVHGGDVVGATSQVGCSSDSDSVLVIVFDDHSDAENVAQGSSGFPGFVVLGGNWIMAISDARYAGQVQSALGATLMAAPQNAATATETATATATAVDYPDAAAVLAALQSAGIPCTQIPGTYAPTVQAVGQTSQVGCTSDTGTVVYVTVFDNHDDAQQMAAAALAGGGPVVLGTNWIVAFADPVYAARVQSSLGGTVLSASPSAS
jgi:hypothetical protein